MVVFHAKRGTTLVVLTSAAKTWVPDLFTRLKSWEDSTYIPALVPMHMLRVRYSRLQAWNQKLLDKFEKYRRRLTIPTGYNLLDVHERIDFEELGLARNKLLDDAAFFQTAAQDLRKLNRVVVEMHERYRSTPFGLYRKPERLEAKLVQHTREVEELESEADARIEDVRNFSHWGAD